MSKTIQLEALRAWIETAQRRAADTKAVWVEQRSYDLCRMMDGRADCLWELMQWAEWNAQPASCDSKPADTP